MCDVVGGADCGENDEISHTLETEGVFLLSLQIRRTGFYEPYQLNLIMI